MSTPSQTIPSANIFRIFKMAILLLTGMVGSINMVARTNPGMGGVPTIPAASLPVVNNSFTSNLEKFKQQRVNESGEQQLSFIENKGQVNDQNNKPRKDIDYTLHAAAGLNIFIGGGSIHYQFSKGASPVSSSWEGNLLPDGKKKGIADEQTSYTMYRMDVELVGANKKARIITEQEQEYYEHYFTPGTGDNGAVAHTYKKITYREVYPNIDWVLYISSGKLKHEFVVRAGGKVSDIKLKYGGATDLQINKEGNIVAITPQGDITEDAPFTYQRDGKNISSRFVLRGAILGYETGEYKGELIVDPGLGWATYYGGSDYDGAAGQATDGSNNLYVCGVTQSTSNIATAGAHQVALSGSQQDGFLVKFNSAGGRLWATYYGGTSYETGASVAVDGSGNVYMCGETRSSSGISTAGAHQTSLTGTYQQNAFLVKFNSAGIRLWGTYYSGNTGQESGTMVVIDGNDNVFMSGRTASTTGIATAGADQTGFGAPISYQSFLVKFNSSGTRQWGTYVGGNSYTQGSPGLAVDAGNNVYISGAVPATSTTGIATAGAYQTATAGGNDAFLIKYSNAGVRLWGTFYGGAANDAGNSVVIDGSGNVFLCGSTQSTSGITTPGAYQSTFGGSEDAYLVKFNGSGARLWGTYYGGTDNDLAYCLIKDGSDNIYMSGYTYSTTGIATAGAFQSFLRVPGNADGFLVKFNNTGIPMWGTYFPAYGELAIDGNGIVYMAGSTTVSSGIATTGSYQSANGGGNDAFIAQFLFDDWYSKPTGDLNLLSSWGGNRDGSGTAPFDFNKAGNYNIVNNLSPTISAIWTPVGAINVGDGTAAVNFTIPSGFAYTGSPINVLGGATLSISNATIPLLGALKANSTVNYNATLPQTVTPLLYSNLTAGGSGIKTTTGVTVTGILSMEGDASVSAAVTYSVTATLKYNNATPMTVGAEWPSTFSSTGGVVIANTGAVTMNAAKTMGVNIPLTINNGATLNTADLGLSLAGNFINNGTIIAGSSPITITGSGTQSIGGFTTTGVVQMTKTSGTATFNGNVNGGALTINGGSSATLNLGAGRTHAFTGNWTRTNGILNGNTALLKIAGSISGTGGTFTAATGTIEWNAAGAQTIAGLAYNNLTISGSGIKTAAGAINTTTLNFAGGILNTGSFAITMPGILANVTGTNATSYVDGTFIKTVNGSSAINYEVGDASGYAPMQLTPAGTATAGSIGVKATSGSHPNQSTSLLIPGQIATHYWTVTNNSVSGITGIIPKVTYNAGDIPGGNNSAYVIQKYAASAWSGVPVAATNAQAPYTTTANSGIASFAGDYIVGAALPIWYSKASGSLDLLATWGSNPDGSGSSPASFSTPGQAYVITNNPLPALTGDWDPVGIINAGDGTFPVSFTIPAAHAYTGSPINLLDGSVLTITNTIIPSLGTMNVTSTVIYDNSASQTIAPAAYGNLTLGGVSGTVAYTALGDITVNGILMTSLSTTTLNMGTNQLLGTLNGINNNGIIRTQAATATAMPAGKIWTGTIAYDGAAQTVASGTYNNLTLAGSGTKTTTGVTVNGTLSMEGAATASVALTYGSTATLQYNTTIGMAAGPEWPATFNPTGGVIIANTGTVTMNATKTMSLDVPLTINSGATLSTGASNFGLTFGGNFINNGTLNAGSSAIAIANTGTQSISGFTTTGLVSMTKTGGTATLQGNVNGGSLTVNGSGGTLNMGTGLTHTFTGNWTRTNGTLDGGSSTLKVMGNISGAGGAFTPNTGTVEWGAAGNQTIAGLIYNNLTVSGSGTKTISTNAAVTGVLTFNGGVLNTSSFSITTPGGATNVTGAGAASYVNGNLAKTNNGSLPINFEVGDANGYAPMMLTPDAAITSGGLTVKVTAGAHPNVLTSGLVHTGVAGHYWTITNNSVAGPTAIAPKATYNLADIPGGNNSAFGTQRYAASAWLGAPLATTNTQLPYTSATNTGIALASLNGDYIFAPVAPVWYSKSTGDLNNAATWGANPDGSGSSPADMNSYGIFNIVNNLTPTITGTWAVAGIVNVGDGVGLVNFTVPPGFAFTVTGTTNILAGATLTIANTTVPTLGTVAATSTVIYNATGAQTVAAKTYGNLTLGGSGIKTTTGVTVSGILSMEGAAAASAAPTYGSAATLQYNPATPMTAGPEWPSTFSGAGGVIISNTGAVTMNAAKTMGLNVPLTINSGATLSTGSSNFGLTFGGDFINNGTLSAGSSPITIANTGTQSISGFTTTGIVSMTKTSGIATLQGNVNGGTLTINGNGGTLNLGAGLTHTFGAWTRGNGTLNAGSALMKVSGNVTGTAGTFTAGTGTVEYNGTEQTIAGGLYHNLTISGTWSKTQLSAATVAAALNFSGALLNTGAFTMTISQGATITGAGATGYVIGTLNKPVPGQSVLSYEVGDANGYAPMQITLTGTPLTGTIGVKVTNGLHPNVATSLLAGGQVVTHYWTLTNNGVSGVNNVTPKATYAIADIPGGDNSGYVTQKFRSAAWVASPLATTNTSAPYTSVPAAGIPLAISNGDYIFGKAITASSTWYSKATGDLNLLATWGANTDGTGASPTDFAASGQVFNIRNNATPTISAPWAPVGAVFVGDGTIATNFTIPAGAAYTGSAIFVNANATLTIANTTTPVLGLMATTSTVIYNGSASQTVQPATYGNLTVGDASGTVTYNAGGPITVSGILKTNLATTTLNMGANQLLAPGTITNNGTIETKYTGALPIPTGKTWGGTVLYDGSSAQAVSSGTYTNLSLNNSAGVSLIGTTTVSGILNFMSGSMITGSNSLTMNGTVTGMSATNIFRCNGAGSMTIGGSAFSFGTIFFDQATDRLTNALANFTLQSSGGGTVTLGNKMVTNTDFTITGGKLELNGQNLTTLGTMNTPTGGTSGLKGDVAASLTFEGTGTGGYVSFAGGNDLGTFTMNMSTASSRLKFGNSFQCRTAMIMTRGSIDPESATIQLYGSFSSTSAATFTSQDGFPGDIYIQPGTGTLDTFYFGQGTDGTTNVLRTLIMNRPGSTFILGSKMVSGNGIQLTNGNVVLGGNALTLNGSFIGSAANSLTCDASASLTVGGTGALGTLYFDAATDGTTNALSSLTINRTSSGTVTLGNDVHVNNRLTLTAGKTTLGAGNLSIGSSGTISGTPSATNMLVATGTGQLRKKMSANESFTYPVGDAANYTPITLSVAGNGYNNAYVGINLTNVKHPQNANATDFLKRFWSVSVAGIDLPQTSVTGASYVAGDVTGNEANMSAAIRGTVWKKFGVTNTVTHSLTTPAVADVSFDVSGLSLPDLSVSGSPDVAVNAGNSTLLETTVSNGDGPFTYSWSPSGSLSSATGAAVTATPPASTAYTVTVTDANGFTATAVTRVTVNGDTDPAEITGNTTICQGATTALSDATAGGTWSTPNTTIASIDGDGVVVGLTAGAAVISYATADGSATATVTVNPRPSISTKGNNGPVCANSTLNLASTATGGTGTLNYAWAGPNAFNAAGQNASVAVMTLAASGIYTIVATDVNGCADTSNTSALVNPRPLITAKGNNGPVCAGRALNLTSNATGGTGTLSYAWAGPNAFSAAGQNASVTVATLAASGNYTIIATDINGCADTSQTSALVNPRPSITAKVNNGPVCAGRALNLTSNATGGTGTLSYAWAGPNAFSAVGQNASVAVTTLAASGIYTIVATDVNGCADTSNTSALVNPRPLITAKGNNGPVCAGRTLNLTSNATGGTGTLSYAWAGPNAFSAAGQNASVTVATLAASGTYTIIATDINGCADTSNTSALVNPRPSITSEGNTSPGCVGTLIGLTSLASGGTGTLNYLWKGPGAYSTAGQNAFVMPSSTAASGSYTITVTDANGCADTSMTSVVVSPTPVIGGAAQVCVGSLVMLSSNIGGGTWSTSFITIATVDGSGNVTGAAQGAAVIEYEAPVTGCIGTRTVTISPIPDAIIGNTTVLAGATTALSNTVGGGVWSSVSPGIATINSVTGVVTGVLPGTAVINYTMAGSCSVTTTVTVNAAATSNIVCVGQTTMLDNGGVPGGTWSSNNGSIATVATATGRVTGVNQGTVIMNYFRPSGGITTTTVTVKPLSQTTGLTTVCAGKSMTLTNTSAGPGMWASSDEDIAVVNAAGTVSGASAGVVTISFTAANGCVATKTITVNPSAQISGITAVCVGKTTNLSNSIGGGIWSSSTGAQATVSATGTVYGVASGAPRINYILATGCQSTVTVTVNPLVAITPTTATVMCQGQSVLLANTVSGGVWSSDNSAIASVNTSGNVTGTGSGSALVSYTTAAGCVATKAITINPTAAITGSMQACVGQLTNLSNSIGGGTWSSSTLAYASVSPAGVVTGVAAGNALIKYNMPGGCNSTATVAVGALSPITITSGAGCQGQTIILANATPGGGVWSSSNTMVATVNTSGVVTGIINGSVSIYFTTPAGCVATKTVSIAPTSPITGSLTVCVGQSTNVSNSLVGGVWSTSSGSLAQVSTSGVVTGVAAGTPKLFYIWPNGCQETATVTVRALSPTTGGTNAMCASSSMTLANATPFGGVWSSSNTSAATVSASGFVKGTGAGVTLISFTTNTDGCVATRTVTVNACRQADTSNTTSVLVQELSDDVRLFPNPNKGIFMLKGHMNTVGDEEVHIEVVNMVGQVIYQGTAFTHQGDVDVQVLLPGTLANGMYLLNLRTTIEHKLFHFVVGQ